MLKPIVGGVCLCWRRFSFALGWQEPFGADRDTVEFARADPFHAIPFVGVSRHHLAVRKHQRASVLQRPEYDDAVHFGWVQESPAEQKRLSRGVGVHEEADYFFLGEVESERRLLGVLGVFEVDVVFRRRQSHHQ